MNDKDCKIITDEEIEAVHANAKDIEDSRDIKHASMVKRADQSTKSELIGLLCCPFCGSADINDTILPDDKEGHDQWWVCPNCAACGPPASSAVGAIKAWNNRAT
jgi:hypothetical protein